MVAGSMGKSKGKHIKCMKCFIKKIEQKFDSNDVQQMHQTGVHINCKKCKGIK